MEKNTKVPYPIGTTVHSVITYTTNQVCKCHICSYTFDDNNEIESIFISADDEPWGAEILPEHFNKYVFLTEEEAICFNNAH